MSTDLSHLVVETPPIGDRLLAEGLVALEAGAIRDRRRGRCRVRGLEFSGDEWRDLHEADAED
jgi:hypothetical protein